MREIKFRVWDNIDYMSQPFTLNDVMLGKIAFTEDCPVMQYTGLKDWKGKEIYEGDICEGHSDGRGIIKWTDFDGGYDYVFTDGPNLANG